MNRLMKEQGTRKEDDKGLNLEERNHLGHDVDYPWYLFTVWELCQKRLHQELLNKGWNYSTWLEPRDNQWGRNWFNPEIENNTTN